ncbi:NAD-dependent DNA ligase LigA, partial [Clostridium acetobutylicum]
MKLIEDLIEKLNKYSYSYYVLDNPIVADKEYDIMYDELKRLEEETEYINPNSPTQRVGDIILDKFEKTHHKNKLWSLDKAQKKDEVKAFVNKCVKFVEQYNLTHSEKLPSPQFVVTQKLDGLTINCSYNESRLIKSATRGTGEIGEDITEQSKTILNLPNAINYSGEIDVHGEALMTKNALEQYNSNLKVNETPLKNLRNGAAGALRNLNIKETARRKLVAQFYDLSYTDKKLKKYSEILLFLKSQGFNITEYNICNNFDEINQAIDNIGEVRSSLQYDIDGVVIRLNDIETSRLMGYTIKCPKYAIAYKFKAKETTTKLIDVEWNVGRSGRINPTAILEPVELAGVIVKRATLNNMDDIKRKKIKKGARVFLRRSNDVIPEIMGVTEETEGETKEIEAPTICPYCGSEIVK